MGAGGGGGAAASFRAKDHPAEYLGASAASATINYPLWRASAIGQSGFQVASSTAATGGGGGGLLGTLAPSYRHALSPPYKGAAATVLGMTWARAAIFWGSDTGRELMLRRGYSDAAATVLPPLAVSTFVQFVNQPVVRATVTIQDPQSTVPTVWQSVRQIHRRHGVRGLWHGTSAGVLKTVPKYCTAVVVKDVVEGWLAPSSASAEEINGEEDDRTRVLARSAAKSAAAGVAGATLTNPLDVIRNEMFKTNLPLAETVRHLRRQTGWGFLVRKFFFRGHECCLRYTTYNMLYFL